MKKICSCLIILTFFGSCADDENTALESNPATTNKAELDILPAYDANPYDNAGRIFDELFDVYYDGTSRQQDVQSVITDVKTIANMNNSFVNFSSNNTSLSVERVEYLAARSTSDIGGIIASSNLSSTGKISFSNFLISFDTLYNSETDASIMYNAVLEYEKAITNNGLLTSQDKRIILITTSILRYSSYRAKKKPKKNTDPYINIWVTHVFGAEEGAEENLEKAIIQGLVTYIVSNK
jgi:hypothetical protein